jgi:hypothetical protein
LTRDEAKKVQTVGMPGMSREDDTTGALSLGKLPCLMLA